MTSVNPQLEMANIIRFGTTSSPLQISAAGRAQVEEEFGKELFFFFTLFKLFHVLVNINGLNVLIHLLF